MGGEVAYCQILEFRIIATVKHLLMHCELHNSGAFKFSYALGV